MDYYGIFDNNELFDLREDPGEARNLFRDPQAKELVTQMQDELNRLLAENECRREPAWSTQISGGPT